MDPSRYVGLPYGRRGGYDCFGLVRLALRELVGIVLPDYDYPDTPEGRARQVADALAGDFSDWKQVPRPKPLDIVLFHNGGDPHIGLMVARGKYLHASKVAGKSVIGHLTDPLLPPTAFYRAPQCS